MLIFALYSTLNPRGATRLCLLLLLILSMPLLTGCGFFVLVRFISSFVFNVLISDKSLDHGLIDVRLDDRSIIPNVPAAECTILKFPASAAGAEKGEGQT